MTRRRFKILVGVIAVILFAVFLMIRFGGSWEEQPTPVVPQPEQTEEQITPDPDERLEILEQIVDLLKLRDHPEDYVSYLFYVYNYWGGPGISEVVWVEFRNHGQEYRIMGRGEEVFKVTCETRTPSGTIECEVEKKDGKLEYRPKYLAKEKAEELFEKGSRHYFEVRKYFGIDTNEGLRRVIEEEFLGEIEFK